MQVGCAQVARRMQIKILHITRQTRWGVYSLRPKAPEWFSRCTRHGLRPVYHLACSGHCIFGTMCFAFGIPVSGAIFIYFSNSAILIVRSS